MNLYSARGCAMAVGVAALCAASNARANTVDIYFSCVGAPNTTLPSAQLRCAIDDSAGPGKVTFRFSNSCGVPSSIMQIFFDDGTLFANPTPISVTQVGASFAGASGGNLPLGGAVTPAFVATSGFVAGPGGGIDTAADYARFTYQLLPNLTFEDTLEALRLGDLRLGLHVKETGSVTAARSYVNNPLVQIVPLPAAAWTGLAGLAMIAGFRVARRSAR